MYNRQFLILCFLTTVLLSCAVAEDICSGAGDLSSAVFDSSLPAGGTAAGDYTPYKIDRHAEHTTQLARCVMRCCGESSCDVAVLHGGTCLLLACDRAKPEGCRPEKQEEGVGRSPPTTVIVRPLHSQGPKNSLLGGPDGEDDLTTPPTTDNEGTGSKVAEDDTGKSPSDKHAGTGAGDKKNRNDKGLGVSKSGDKDGTESDKEEAEDQPKHATHGDGNKKPDTSHDNKDMKSNTRLGSTELDLAGDKASDNDKHDPKTGDKIAVSDQKPADDKKNEEETGDKTETTGDKDDKDKGGTDDTKPADESVRGSLTCYVGINETCRAHEECEQTNRLKRQGRCRCVTGYTRPDVTAFCVKDDDDSKMESSTTTPKLELPEEKKEKKTTTSTTLATTTPAPVPLLVSVGGSKQLRLPEDSLELNAFVLPQPVSDKEYAYEWKLVEGPGGKKIGQFEGLATSSLHLSGLIEGIYKFKVTVTGDGKFGEELVNVTVSSPARTNTPPVAIIKPEEQTVLLPNSAILDGSDSTDDTDGLKYRWEVIEGPLNEHPLTSDKSMLELKDIAPGEYTFRLTVTDSDGATNSTDAKVTVDKVIDYPPRANAGSDRVISLPQTSVTLHGNTSTDDHEIAAYEWSADTTADMKGVKGPILLVENLGVGDYTFTLKVTDTAGQSDTATVHVFVKPQQNTPPNATVVTPMTISLPATSATLDGSASEDDKQITQYSWSQTRGPSKATIVDPERVVTGVSGLGVGDYTFLLTVTDIEAKTDTATVDLRVLDDRNHAPEARAGPDVAVALPVDLLVLDGSGSSDDRAITSYTWTRGDKSPAAGRVINGSDHGPKLALSGLEMGRYSFTLTVRDAEGLQSEDTADVVVTQDPREKELVEISVDEKPSLFTKSRLQALVTQLQLLLDPTVDGEASVVVREVSPLVVTSGTNVVLYAQAKAKDTVSYVPGPELVSLVKPRLSVLDSDVRSISTVLCQTNCSGRGHCDQLTKRCVCESFWTENVFAVKFRGADTNCDWSVLYVVIVVLVLLLVLAAMVWIAVCCCKRSKGRRRGRRHKYQQLRQQDDSDGDEARHMLPAIGKRKGRKKVVSASGESSQEELFQRPRQNGKTHHGSSSGHHGSLDNGV